LFLQVLFAIGRQTGRLKDSGAEKESTDGEERLKQVEEATSWGADSMTIRESDQLIVLGDGRADHMGKGLAETRS
jgi:hypothetical protein